MIKTPLLYVHQLARNWVKGTQEKNVREGKILRFVIRLSLAIGHRVQPAI